MNTPGSSLVVSSSEPVPAFCSCSDETTCTDTGTSTSRSDRFCAVTTISATLGVLLFCRGGACGDGACGAPPLVTETSGPAAEGDPVCASAPLAYTSAMADVNKSAILIVFFPQWLTALRSAPSDDRANKAGRCQILSCQPHSFQKWQTANLRDNATGVLPAKLFDPVVCWAGASSPTAACPSKAPLNPCAYRGMTRP